MKILVFEDDPSLANLLKVALVQKGHDVLVFSDPTACPVYLDHDSTCPRKTPCADAVISDYRMPNMTGLDFYKLQRLRGCKALDKNKALVTGTKLTEVAMREIEELGCHYIKKPFKITEITEWVDSCEERLN